MRKANIDKDTLVDLYIKKGLTQKKCGEILGYSQTLISKKLKEYEIESRNRGEHCITKTIVEMSDEMTQMLDGALLGDGSLVKLAVNARFLYESKSKEHVDYVCNLFKQYASGEYINEKERYDKRTKKYYHRCQYESICSPTFTRQYERWYPDGIKHIPDDLVITPLICKIWYIGDGSLIGNKNNNSQRIVLYTNCFEKEEIEEILLPQLQEFEPYLLRMNNKLKTKGYAICIGKKENIKKFIKYIGECPFDDYLHKWNIKESLLQSTKKEQEENEKNDSE